MKKNDIFYLYDLRVSVEGNPKTFVCSHKIGPAFDVIGENIIFHNNKSFSLYALSAILPLLPAKQRETDVNDWMTTDDLVACPDPNCGARFKITRLSKSQYSHSDVTITPSSNKTRMKHE